MKTNSNYYSFYCLLCLTKVLSVFNKPEHIKKIFENCFVAGQIEKPLTQQSLKDIAHKKSIGVISSL